MEKSQQTTQKCKRSQTTMSSYISIKWTTWKKWTNSQKRITFQNRTRKKQKILTDPSHMEIETVIRNLPTKAQDHTTSQLNSTKNLEKSYHLSYSNSSRKLQRKVNFQTHSMRPPRQRQHKERKLQAHITDEHRCKNSQQNSRKQNPTTY